MRGRGGMHGGMHMGRAPVMPMRPMVQPVVMRPVMGRPMMGGPMMMRGPMMGGFAMCFCGRQGMMGTICFCGRTIF